MQLSEAVKTISVYMGKMDESYQRKVFDEWLIVETKSGKDEILGYIGPREDTIGDTLSVNLKHLRSALENSRLDAGDFEFTREGEGEEIDAFIVLGDGLYLICNATEKSMHEVTQDPLWAAAQVHFVSLCDKIRMNPVAV